MLVDDVQELEDPPVGGLVELVVERPDLIGALGAQALGWHSGLAETGIGAVIGDPQPRARPSRVLGGAQARSVPGPGAAKSNRDSFLWVVNW